MGIVSYPGNGKVCYLHNGRKWHLLLAGLCAYDLTGWFRVGERVLLRRKSLDSLSLGLGRDEEIR